MNWDSFFSASQQANIIIQSFNISWHTNSQHVVVYMVVSFYHYGVATCRWCREGYPDQSSILIHAHDWLSPLIQTALSHDDDYFQPGQNLQQDVSVEVWLAPLLESFFNESGSTGKWSCEEVCGKAWWFPLVNEFHRSNWISRGHEWRWHRYSHHSATPHSTRAQALLLVKSKQAFVEYSCENN